METTLAKAALPRSRPPRRRAALFALSLLGLSLLALSLLALSSAAQAWQRPHGVGSNTGLEDVVTAAAVTPLRPPVSLGSLAVGAGPVVAPDGTVAGSTNRAQSTRSQRVITFEGKLANGVMEGEYGHSNCAVRFSLRKS